MWTPFCSYFFTIFTLNLFFGSHVYSVPYDHTYKLECVAKPDAPLYNGGIAENPEFNEELKGWKAAGGAKIEVAKSSDGNSYAVASNLLTPVADGISQTFNVDKDQFYTVSAWIQVVGNVSTKVHAAVVASTGSATAGVVIPKTGCWTMLKGGFDVNVTESVELHFAHLSAAIYINAKAMPPVYLMKINELRDGGYDGPLGIGLQCHHDYNDPNIPFVRASLDVFAATGLAIWITEFTVDDKLPNQLKYLKMLLSEYHSHPAVKGIVIWSGVDPNGNCWSMCLTDLNYKNKPAGDVVDDFMHQFIRVPDSNGTTDSNGVFEASLVHGEYEANVALSNGAQSPASQTFNLVPDGNLNAVELKINL